MLRDGDVGPFGYFLFAALLLIAGLMIACALRLRLAGHAAIYCLVTFLLLLVAVTPSNGAVHVLCSLVVFVILYAYYATLLCEASSSWLWIHLTIPVLLVLVTRAHSYGLWQKCFIVWFLLAINVHY